jgi:hypothetical protein
VYGSLILAFPEQFMDVTYFNMLPKQGSGWEARTDVRTIRGIVQCKGGRKLVDANGNLVVTRNTQLWTQEVLEVGRFVEFTETGRTAVYRLSADDEWDKEGGFNVYNCDKVVGANGIETKEPTFTSGGYKLA